VQGAAVELADPAEVPVAEAGGEVGFRQGEAPQDAAPVVDHVHVGVGEVGCGPFHGGQTLGNHGRQEHVVGGDVGAELARGGPEAGVQGRAQAAVPLVMQDTDQPVLGVAGMDLALHSVGGLVVAPGERGRFRPDPGQEVLDDRGRVVGGAVVDDDELDVGVLLEHDRVQGHGQVLGLIVHRRHDGDEGHDGLPWPLRRPLRD
jgi:hypothetical protein